MANVNDVERVLNRKDQGQQPKWTEVNPEVGTEEVFDFFVDRFPFLFLFWLPIAFFYFGECSFE